jgi:superfamily II DNA or RNA helicase
MPLRDYQQEALDALENYIAIEDGNPPGGYAYRFG